MADQHSPTARAILGILAMRPCSGYEIKQMVDASTRFFWAASYGQIYPELRRLTEAGLVTGTDSPTGDRRRTIHRLTAKGREALARWFDSPPEVYETRDEGLLKLFFASAVAPERAAEIARHRGAHSADIAARLRAIESALAERGTQKPPSAHTVLRFGIELNEWIADWCERAAADLDRQPAAAKRS